MATTQVMKVTVESLTKFGFKADGKFINWSKNFPEAAKVSIVPGVTFEGEVYTGDSGKGYLNKVVKMLDSKPPVEATKPRLPKAVNTPSNSDSMTRADWDAKDKRISRQGAIQAAVQATGGDFEAAEELADRMLMYVNEVK